MKKYALLFVSLFLSGCFAATPDSRFYLLENPRLVEAVSTKKSILPSRMLLYLPILTGRRLFCNVRKTPNLKFRNLTAGHRI